MDGCSARTRMFATRRCLLALAGLVLWIAPGPAALAQDAEARTRTLLRTADIGRTEVSVAAMDLDTGRWLIELDADEPRIPASNMKLVTTAAAIELLGPRFVFRTELRLVGPGPGPDAVPSLAVIGSGDPGTGDPKLLRGRDDGLDAEGLLDSWVQKVADTGHRRFERLVIDDRIFDRQFTHPGWPSNQLIEWYCAQVAGINFYDNCIDVLAQPAARPGLAPEVTIYPASPFIDTTNLARTGKNDRFWIGRKPGTNAFTFNGTVRHRHRRPISVTVHDPPRFFAQLLVHRLARAGIVVDQVQRAKPGAAPIDGTTLAAIETSLPEVLTRTNRDSMNLFAEALLKRMGHAVTGAAGSFENGAAAVRIYMHQVLGPRSAVAAVADGSGLSRDNRLTARLLVRLLRRMHDSPNAGMYRASLAYAGRDLQAAHTGTGTLDDRFQALKPGSWVFGKSGYINGVSTLSGYLVVPVPDQPDRQRVAAFAILCNGFEPPVYNPRMKALQEQIVGFLETRQRQAVAVPEPAGR